MKIRGNTVATPINPEKLQGPQGYSIFRVNYDEPLKNPNGNLVCYLANFTPRIHDMFITSSGYVGEVFKVEGNSNGLTKIYYNYAANLNGEQGEKGDTGVGIQYMTQSKHSTASGGQNIWQAKTTDGQTYSFYVYNGAAGHTPVRGTDYWTPEDKNEIVKQCSPILTDSGEVISLTDASDFNLQGLTIYGKTTQNGTPTPDAPIPLVSAGSGGSITVTVSGGDTEQTIPIPTPNGLLGVPVSSGGNFTDTSGQQWVCDEIDFTRGVYIQRIKTNTLTGQKVAGLNKNTGGWVVARLYLDSQAGFEPLSSSFVGTLTGKSGWDTSECVSINAASSGYAHICLSINRIGLDTNGDGADTALRNYLNAHPVDITYVTNAPTETPLTEEELAVLANVHTNKPNTTVYNDAGTYMDLEYIADTNITINNMHKRIAELEQMQNALLGVSN